MARKEFNQIEFKGLVGERPSLVSVTGPAGRFRGIVNYDNRVVNSPDRDWIKQVFRHASQQFDDSPTQLDEEWKVFCSIANPRRFRADQSGNRQMREMQQRMEERMKEFLPPGFRIPDFLIEENGGKFSYSFDGQNFQFNGLSIEEIQAKTRERLGSFANLAEEIQNK